MKKNLLVLAILVLAAVVHAQRNLYLQEARSNEGSVILLNFSYGVLWPGGDLADRFGYNFTTGGTMDFMTKNNFIIGLQPSFHFGSEVKEDVLAKIRNEDGIVFGDDGALAEVKLRERGIYLGAYLGKLFSIQGDANRRAGIRFTIGAGLLQHKIRIQDDPQVSISLLTDAYKKGYDRLTNGVALTEFVGYQYLAKNRRINFVAGLEFTQGFTQSRRSFNYDTRSRDDSRRIDLLTGFRLSWTLPLYVGEKAEEIRY